MDGRSLRHALDGAGDPAGCGVVLLPDFYVDHFLPLASLDAFGEAARERGARTIEGQAVVPGGNAAHTALALARLGASVALVTRTSEVGAALLEASLGAAGVDLALARADGELALTLALEFPGRNVMLTSCSDRAFGPDDLLRADWRAIDRADAVAVANWTNPRADELAAAVLTRAARAGATTFVDAGAPEARIVRSPDLHVLALNAMEVRRYCPGSAPGAPGLIEAALDLSRETPARVDLHTVEFAASFRGGRAEAIVPAFAVRARRETGAGDAFNAGDLLGTLLGLAPGDRLLLANAVAAAYVTSEHAMPPTLLEAAAFAERTPLKPLTAAAREALAGNAR